MSAPPVAVIGAGPAGCAAACVLARAGRRTVLLERELVPGHKICGEFLGGPALRGLAALDVDVMALGAHAIRRVRLVRGARVVERALPFDAAGLSRRALDAALRARAVALGATLHGGVRVRDATADLVQAESGGMTASAVVLATGKHDLRGHRRDAGAPADPMVGLKQHLRLAPAAAGALAGTIELHVFRDGYAGLQMIEGGTANLCLLVRAARFARVGAGWDGLLASLASESPVFAQRIGDARPCLAQPLAIARIPYGFLHRDSAAADGLYRVGDQMAVIPSFAGEGIAIALRTGIDAAAAVLRGDSARAHHAAERRALARPVGIAHALYRAGCTRTGQGAITAAARLPGALAAMARATRCAA